MNEKVEETGKVSSAKPTLKIIQSALGVISLVLLLLFCFSLFIKENWRDDYSQSSIESTTSVAKLLWWRGEPLLIFDLYTEHVPDTICEEGIATDFAPINVKIYGTIHTYRFLCDKFGNVTLSGDIESTLRTMHSFELAEKRGEDVKLEVWNKSFTFNAAGYKESVEQYTKEMQSR